MRAVWGQCDPLWDGEKENKKGEGGMTESDYAIVYQNFVDIHKNQGVEDYQGYAHIDTVYRMRRDLRLSQDDAVEKLNDILSEKYRRIA